MVRKKVDTNYLYLSSKIRFFKTEHFIKQTKHFVGVDNLLFILGEAIICSIKDFENTNNTMLDGYSIKIDNIQIEFCFKFAKNTQLNTKLNENDIIFYDCKFSNQTRKRDTRLFDFLAKNKTFFIQIDFIKEISSKKDFLKLYLLSSDDGVNFPLLNDEQQALINIQDQNVLVQGVAGSGKTNICINKLVYTALREYGGKVLYSTYSKALLLDIKNKLEVFKENIKRLNNSLKQKRVIFTDSDQIKAVENRLGILIDVSNVNEISSKLDRIEQYLSTHIDLYLIEDLAEKYNIKKSNEGIATEKYFIKQYIPNIKNYQLVSKLEKLKYLSYEIIYKEIYGNIFGAVKNPEKEDKLSLKDYKELRKQSFSNLECEIIYSIAQDYKTHLEKNNLVDNNILTNRLLKIEIEKYSLVVLDEVQDFTQINLMLFKKLARRMFCVGDALQMINPSYFSFAFLKNLMFEENLSNVKKLTNNYRNSGKIEKIVQKLSDINTKQFGVHNFVLQSQSIDNELTSKTFYLLSDNFVSTIKNSKLSNLTFVCSTSEEKDKLKKLLPELEILTISEIKGLERGSIVLLNILSSNYEKWKALERNIINKKTSDENSVYRYYFNLFYVGVTRAKQNLYVVEDKKINLFNELFNDYFESTTSTSLLSILSEENINNDITTEELIERINEFIKLLQFDNAIFVAQRLNEAYERNRQINKIKAYEQNEKDKDNRRLGIALWKESFIEEAKVQFRLSKDYDLIKLMEACQNGDSNGINGNIIEFLPLVRENEVATALIIDTLKSELNLLKDKQQNIDNWFLYKRK